MTVTWPLHVPDVLAQNPNWSMASATDKAAASAAAVQVLRVLTGSILGTVTATVRPCFGPPDEHTTYSGISYAGSGPVIWAGLLQGNAKQIGSCGCADLNCNCRSADRLQLPGPAASITRVAIDGDPVDPASYRLAHHRWLIRTDGYTWPIAQDFNAADDEVGAFVVTYERGVEVGLAGQTAAGRLAYELLTQWGTGGDCAFPEDVTNVDRQGVSITIDPAVWVEAGMTGIRSVDQWIRSVNPSGVREQPRIVIPGRRY